MMVDKNQLTTEHLKRRFSCPFDLVNYSIGLARDMILADRPCRVHTSVNNRAYQVLLEIGEGKDYLEKFDDLDEEDEEEEDEE
jgi:hypothetical protein